MEDSLDAYISQSLIDTSGGASGDFDRHNSLSSDMLLQLLLNTMGTGSALPDTAATIDPNTLNGMDVDEYALTPNTGISADDSADTNSLLAAALLSALGPLPDIAAASEDMHGAESMLVDTSVAAAECSNAPPPTLAPAVTTKARSQPKPSCAAPQKQTIQQQALSTAGKRSISVVGSQKPTPKPATAAPARVAATALQAQKPVGDKAGAYDEDEEDIDMTGIDMKSLSSKERRQLRNKISARNFRVRRKEYISNLEAEVRMHKEEADGVRRELAISRKDNVQLRDEIQRLRQRLSAMSATQPGSAAAATAAVPATAAAAAASRFAGPVSARPAGPASVRPAISAHPTKQVVRTSAVAPTSAPMVRFNPNKDIAQSAAKNGSNGSSATGNNWAAKSGRSGFIAVNAAMLPSAHSTTVDELMAETRRKQVVSALLDIDEPVAALPASECDADSNRADYQALAVARAILGTASLIAELVLPQIALESSLAHVPGPAVLPAISVSC
ncbi:hypothetical protein GGH12_006067 [Coemansia sp. RSA 1822]|nr:hypothetical protein IW147_001297 [Coemansia sp. RSA 720]KAJ2542288.1 hypothetical protein GGF49_003007 [Coemansia sp. RSA 1853]KAJ2557878.1 hypothetical protein GGH12_006067 [Coemansia sp. RSA 1822]